MLIVASYIHIHACANHGREGFWGGYGRRSMSQGATQLPQSVGMRLGTWSTSVDLAWDPIQPHGGGGSGTSDSGGGGECAKSGCWRVQGWSKKVFPPMTWGALSEARRVPPQETVIRGHGGDYCARRHNTSKYNINSYNTDDTYNTGTYIQYRHIHTMVNLRKTIYLTWGPQHLGKVSIPSNGTFTF